MKILIEHACVLTMNQSLTMYPDGWVFTKDDRIEDLGSHETTEATEEFTGVSDTARYQRKKQEADIVLDGDGGILLPGFVNTHCHVSMIPFRSMGDDCPDRLRKFLFPLELDAMTPELVYLGALYGIGEMLLSGITTFADMYYFETDVAKACEEAGIRGYLGETIIGQATCDSKDAAYGGFQVQENFFRDVAGHSRIFPIVAPHGTTTLSPEMLKRAHDIAVDHDMLYTLHACEQDYEMEQFRKQDTTPIRFLDTLGALDAHTLLVHAIHMETDDLDRVQAAGSGIAHCVVSNAKAGKGVAPIEEARKRHIPFGLGTDGASSGNTLSMFDQMRMVPYAQKTSHHDRRLFPAAEVVTAATRGGAEALHAATEDPVEILKGREDAFGTLSRGMKADMVLVETKSVNMFPIYNPYSALVYSANASNVDTVIADGRIVVRDGKLTTINLEKTREALLRAMKPFMASAEQYKDII